MRRSPRPARPTGSRRPAPPHPNDIRLAAAIVALSLLSYVMHLNDMRWGVVRCFLELLAIVPLLWRRQYPVVVSIVSGSITLAITALVHPSQPFPYPVLINAYTIGAETRGPTRVLMALLYLTGDVVAETLHGQRTNVNDYFLTILTSATAFLVGILTQIQRAYARVLEERAAALERDRDAEVARAAAAERARIARDMHDVVGHAVALMVVQAEARPLFFRADTQRAETAFDAISATGRDAMAQLRRLLGVLKQEESDRGGWDDRSDRGDQRGSDGAPARSPQPTLAMLDQLVGQVRAGGLPVALTSAGVPAPLAADAETTAYRVVQEALTNTLKHSGASRSDVSLEWSADELRITVLDDGRGCVDPRGGHGLVGLRERLAAVGGTLSLRAVATGTDASGFELTASIPTQRDGQAQDEGPRADTAPLR